MVNRSSHLPLEGVVEARGAQLLEHGFGADEEDRVPSTAAKVAESRGEVGLADAHRGQDQHVVMSLEKPQAGKLAEQLAIERDLGGVIPGVELQSWIKTGSLRP